MARLLVFSRSIGLALRLYEYHTVDERPYASLDSFPLGDDERAVEPAIAWADVVVLDADEPESSLTVVELWRLAGHAVPFLIVSGYQHAWSSLWHVRRAGVHVVPPPITRATLLAGVDELLATGPVPAESLGTRPDRTDADPGTGPDLVIDLRDRDDGSGLPPESQPGPGPEDVPGPEQGYPPGSPHEDRPDPTSEGRQEAGPDGVQATDTGAGTDVPEAQGAPDTHGSQGSGPATNGTVQSLSPDDAGADQDEPEPHSPGAPDLIIDLREPALLPEGASNPGGPSGPSATDHPAPAQDDPPSGVGGLVAALTRHVPQFLSVREAAQSLADELLRCTRADAVAVLVRDGACWRVSGEHGLRPSELGQALTEDHPLVRRATLAPGPLTLGESAEARLELAGAPLVTWQHVLIGAAPEVPAVVVLARGERRPAFAKAQVNALRARLAHDSGVLTEVVAIRHLARLLDPLTDRNDTAALPRG